MAGKARGEKCDDQIFVLLQKSRTDHRRFEKYWTETFRYHWTFRVKSDKDKEMEKNKLNYSLSSLPYDFNPLMSYGFLF